MFDERWWARPPPPSCRGAMPTDICEPRPWPVCAASPVRARARAHGPRRSRWAGPTSLRLPTTLFLVDGNNLLWRAAHGWRAPFDADDGRDLTPLFRFITLLRRALGTYGVFAECIVCLDGADAWSDRLDVDASYKSNRSYE